LSKHPCPPSQPNLGFILKMLNMQPKAPCAAAILFLLCSGPSLSYGQTPTEPPEALIRKAVQNYSSRVDHTKNYAYLEVVGTSWNGFKPTFNTYENMLVDGKPHRKHIRFNGQLVPPESADDEMAKVRSQIESCSEFKVSADKVENTSEVPASGDGQAAYYRQGCLKYRKLRKDLGLTRGGCGAHFPKRLFNIDNMGLQLPIESLVSGFEIALVGIEELEGRPSIVVDAMPTSGADGRSGDLSNFKLRIWIDQAEFEFAKLEGSAIETRLLSTADYFKVDFRKKLSDKFVAAVQRSLTQSTMKYGKDTTVSLRWRKINGDAWLPTEVRIRGNEVVNWPACDGNNVSFLFETSHPTHIYVTFDEYKKFRAETRIIGIDE
jgi:hypothetical protein